MKLLRGTGRCSGKHYHAASYRCPEEPSAKLSSPLLPRLPQQFVTKCSISLNLGSVLRETETITTLLVSPRILLKTKWDKACVDTAIKMLVMIKIKETKRHDQFVSVFWAVTTMGCLSVSTLRNVLTSQWQNWNKTESLAPGHSSTSHYFTDLGFLPGLWGRRE